MNITYQQVGPLTPEVCARLIDRKVLCHMRGEEWISTVNYDERLGYYVQPYSPRSSMVNLLYEPVTLFTKVVEKKDSGLEKLLSVHDRKMQIEEIKKLVVELHDDLHKDD